MKLKYTAVRRYMQDKNLATSHSLESCPLVIDGDSYFRNTYKNSGCQFILGPDCDRYADYIKNKLKCFVDNNITCFVVFGGGTKHELEKREETHKKIIENRNDIEKVLGNGFMEYYQPLFVKDVQKQVLDEMKMKFFVCEYDSIEAIVGVARKFKCPVITNNIEYCLFGVSCIQPNSVGHQLSEQPLKCTILEHEKFKTAFGVYGKMPILLTLLNENGVYLNKVREIIDCESYFIPSIVRLVKSQRAEGLISKVLKTMNDENGKAFLEVYEKIQNLYLYPSCSPAVKYFQRQRPHGLFRDDKKWFAKGVANGRIAIPYIDMKVDRVICGSRLIYNDKRPDALLAATDIIVYAHCLLTNSQDSGINFIGRKLNGSGIEVTEIQRYWDKKISNRLMFAERRNGKRLNLITGETDLFKNFLNEILPTFDYNKFLETVPENCWILIITLVYYICKKNEDFKNGAYCVLLSYLMLGPVSYEIDVLKKNHPSLDSNNEDCVNVFNGLKFLFERVDFERKYNTNIVHSFSEFQHCLQHMNYLNKLCGEKIPCTVYQKTYNATFIYNTFLFKDGKYNLMNFLENQFFGSKFLNKYNKIVTVFENCISVVKK